MPGVAAPMTMLCVTRGEVPDGVRIAIEGLEIADDFVGLELWNGGAVVEAAGTEKTG